MLISSAYNSGELLHLDVLSDDGSLGLILLVQWDLDDGALNLPSANLLDELITSIARKTEPRLKHRLLELANGLGDGKRNAYSDELFETRHIGDEVGVEIITVEGAPEGGI